MKRGLVRKVILWIHLVAGLSSALVLVVIGLTGATLAFRDSYGRWANRDFFNVKPAGPPMSQDAILAKVEAEYAPSRVESINLIWDDAYQYYFMNDRGPLIVNSIDGRILDPRAGESFTSKLIITANDLHKKLALGKVGELTRDIATYEVLVLIPTGIILWWRSRRFGVKWKASWYKRIWDFHNTIGIAISLPILFLAFTGTLIALRLPAQFAASSESPPKLAAPNSVPLDDASQRVPDAIAAALAAADKEVPDIATYQVEPPVSPTAPIAINKSEGGFAARGHRTTVYVDQYSGKVLRVDRAQPYTAAYKAYTFGKRLHTGEKFGTVGMAILMLSSVLFALLAMNGIVLGIWKLSNWMKRSQVKRERPEIARSGL